MAFQSLVNGAECSTGSNPLSQFMKGVNEDPSLRKEAFLPGPEQGGSSAFRTRRPTQPPSDQFAEEFLNQHQEDFGPQPLVGPAQPGPLILKEHGPEFTGLSVGGWATEFSNQTNHARQWELGKAEEAEMEEAFKRMNMQSTWQAEFLERPQLPNDQIAEHPPEFEAVFQKNFDWASEFALKQDKGKAKIVELDDASWEAEFVEAHRQAEETHQDKEIDEALSAEENKLFEHVWNNVRENIGGETEFAEFDENNTAGGRIDIGDYTFEPENPYSAVADPLQEGINIVQDGGSLSEAALAFEAAVRKDPNSSEAWTWLGNTQAQNEKEEPAIRALEKAIEIDGTNLEALMSLAVSYTNENYEQQSYLTLERWMTAKYPEIVTSSAPMDTVHDTHSRVTELFLRAARNAPDGQQMDPDVQVGLGVLFYGSGDYSKAIDCFVSALNNRPKDYLLWNRLGATLANSGQSEKAIEAYHKALDIKPTFVRARYNLGVSCINIGCYREAAEHLLGALSMHQTSREDVNVSNSLRDTLRRTFIMMDRRELADKVLSGLDVDQFRNEFDF
ncbi:1006_t:CDS:2 [Ambispora gerdemannii]|uniref:1006_t:CDS:1 n=1 Tax=Ambispora gerdemannii TaxID=144530 RepID=A0A9N8VXW4_9GLOM|nr:1006_t:CDS:2 [Ambispora gerdemannii]